MDPDPDQRHKTIELQPGPAVIKAWAPWCSSCRALGPIVDEVAEQTGVAVIDVQVDISHGTVDHFAVRSVPTLIALHDGHELGRLVGLQPSDAVQSLFAVAAGTGTGIRRRSPASLVAVRAATAAGLALAGVLFGSVVLGSIGAALALWALLRLIWR